MKLAFTYLAHWTHESRPVDDSPESLIVGTIFLAIVILIFFRLADAEEKRKRQ